MGYLLWDPGFGHRFLLSLAGLLVTALLALSSWQVQQYAWEIYQEMLFWFMDGAHRMAWWSVIGLLSSSCCALQLLLNMLNFGCAGFNTVLGPLRPGLCAFTLCLQAAVWATAYQKPFQLIYVAPCTVLAVVLTLLPEITYLWVARMHRHAERTGTGTFAQSRLRLKVEGMGCVACTKKVAEVLDSVPQVLSREVLLEEKCVQAKLAAQTQEVQTQLLPKLLQSISEAGFKAELATLEDVTHAAMVDEFDIDQPAEPEPPVLVAEDASCCEASVMSGAGVAGLPLSIISGLASSSCCLLQLGVNLLATLNLAHVGCAGFNKVLGPIRPQLRLVTGAWLAGSWGLHVLRRRPEKVPQAAFSARQRNAMLRLLWRTLLCLLLTFLPEVLLWSGGPGMAPDVQGAEVLKLKVDGMGCEACQVHVQNIIDRTGGVVSSHVDFALGHAELVINRDWSFDLAGLKKKLVADGYDAEPIKIPFIKSESLEL